MFKRKEDEQLFFSTKVELKINGMTFRPSICYSVPSLAKASLEKYAAQGKVVFHKEQVRFVNGAVAPLSAVQAFKGVESIGDNFDYSKPPKKKGE